MAVLTMSLSLLLMTVLVAATRDYRDAVADTLLFVPYNNAIDLEPFQAKPDFCKKLECPLYKVIEKKDSYELREYAEILWVSTRVQNIDYNKATYTNFMKLFHYIQGENVKKQKIDMTVPVLNKIIPGQGPACESDFTLNFFLTQNATAFCQYPKPTDASVKLVKTPVFRVYVRSFAGYVMKYDGWREEAEKLIQAIGDVSKYDTSAWYTAGYDSPFTLFNRHNEIWFFAK